MKKLIILSLLIPLLAFAKELPMNEKYSFQAFPYHDLSFKDVPAKEFNNTIIRGSCFYQEWREGEEIIKDIFPDGMTGVTFLCCNLDNIYIPPGNKVEYGTNKRIQVQNDFQAWILDDQLKPKEPMDKEMRLEAGVSIDPKDIPAKKFTPEERKQFEETLMGITPDVPKSGEAGFASTPLLVGGGIGVVLLALITIFFKRIRKWLKF
jgi:hypothetical protein